MKKSTKIIIAVVSVLVIVAAVLAILYFTTDIFDGIFKKKGTPKEAFYEYLGKTASGDMNYEQMLANLKKAQTESASAKGKMSMNIEFGSTLSEYNEIAKVLNKMEISFDSKTDPKNINAYSSMNVKYDGKDLGTFEVITDKDTIGIKFAEMYDKYLTLTMDEIEELLEDAGMDMPTTGSASYSMDNIDVNEIVEILEISNDELTRIKDRYSKVLKDAIPEENYKSEKEKITVSGKEINATGYSVEISDKDLVNLATKILESLKDDDDTIELIVEKANKITELAGEDTKISKSQIKSMIEYMLPSLEKTDELTGEKVKITVYEHKDKTVRISLSMGSDAIILDSMEDGDTTNMTLKVKASGREMTLMNISQTKKGDNAYTTTLSTDIQGLKLEITMDTESSDSKEMAKMKLYLEVPNTIKATLNVESEAKYESVNIDKLSSSNSTAIKSLTESDEQKLAINALNYIDKNMSTIKEIGTSLGLKDEVEEFENQINALKTQAPASTTPEDEDDAA